MPVVNALRVVNGGIGDTDSIIGDFFKGFDGDGEFYPGLAFLIGEVGHGLGVDFADAALVTVVDSIVFFGDMLGFLGVGLEEGFKAGVEELVDVFDEGSEGDAAQLFGGEFG